MPSLQMKNEIQLSKIDSDRWSTLYRGVQPETGYTIEFAVYPDGENPALLVLNPQKEVVASVMLPIQSPHRDGRMS